MGEIRGINLGNWLVLEKWMDPDLFAGTDAEDETFFCINLGEKKRERYRIHRDTFVTEADLAYIASKGFNTIRIPVPFFLFKDQEPYVSCAEYLDKAFDWAEQYNLQILVDLHTVPGSHNGTDNAGIYGLCLWSTKEEYVEYTLFVLEEIARRYGKREGMWGIEVLNEPMCSDTPMAPILNIQNLVQQYVPRDKEVAKQNENYSFNFLKQFYRDAYTRIRKHMSEEKCVVFHDAFSIDIWDEFVREKQFENIVLDTHKYLMMMDYDADGNCTLEDYLEEIGAFGKRLEVSEGKVPTIVGEWCIDNALVRDKTPKERTRILRTISKAYMDAMDHCEGWFYWTYKLNGSVNSLNSTDIRKSISEGWMPDQYEV